MLETANEQEKPHHAVLALQNCDELHPNNALNTPQGLHEKTPKVQHGRLYRIGGLSLWHQPARRKDRAGANVAGTSAGTPAD